MLISHQKRFIFVHVQKTGGMSIETLLKDSFSDANHWHGRHGHAVTGLDEMGRETWDGYYSFAFVRNPWDRLVSWYSMIEAKRSGLPWYKRLRHDPLGSMLWNQLIDMRVRSFADFLDRCTEPVFDKGCWKSFAYNQIDYLTDREGNVIVDKIGRFESLGSEMGEIMRRLGLDDQVLPHKNATPHRHYSQWYDDRTRELVAERFVRDVKAFGYEFEGPS